MRSSFVLFLILGALAADAPARDRQKWLDEIPRHAVKLLMGARESLRLHPTPDPKLLRALEAIETALDALR